jgi:hypothetical protein
LIQMESKLLRVVLYIYAYAIGYIYANVKKIFTRKTSNSWILIAEICTGNTVQFCTECFVVYI